MQDLIKLLTDRGTESLGNMVTCAEVGRVLSLQWEAGRQRGVSVGMGHSAGEWRNG